MKKLKYIVFMIPILFGFINTVRADIITSNRGFYWYTNSSSSYVGNNYVTGTDKFTIPNNSRISAWWVDFDGNSFSFISGQTYTAYLYFTFSDVDYSWVVGNNIEMTVNCVDAPGNPATCTNYVKSYTSAYVSGSNDVVIEFDFIAPNLNTDDIVYISLNNTSSNDYALGYASGNTVYVNFNKLSYYLAGESISAGDNIIIDQNQTIIDQNNKTNEELEDLNDNITSEEMPDTPDFSDLETADDTPISDLILMPINYLNKLINAFSQQCYPYNLDFGLLGIDYTLSIPCIKVEKWIGEFAWNMVDLFICFFMIYEIAMLVVKVFNDITAMRDTYESLYQSKHTEKDTSDDGGGN